MLLMTLSSLCLLSCVSRRVASGYDAVQLSGNAEQLETVPVASFAAHFSEDDQVSEGWRYLFWFSDGHIILAQYVITNAGPGSGRLTAVGTILPPDGPPLAVIKNSRPQERWKHQVDEDGIVLEIAHHVITIKPPRHHLLMHGHKGDFTLDTESTTPAVRPGRMDFSDERYQEQLILAPRLRVKAGTYQLPDGPLVQLPQGWGMALHDYANVAEHKRVVSLLQFDTFDRDLQLSLSQITTPEGFEYQRLGTLMAFEGGKLRRETNRIERTYLGLTEDSEKPGYPVPSGFTLKAQHQDFSVEGTVRFRPRPYRRDVLGEMDSGLLKWVIKRFMNPIEYTFRAD